MNQLMQLNHHLQVVPVVLGEALAVKIPEASIMLAQPQAVLEVAGLEREAVPQMVQAAGFHLHFPKQAA